MEIGDHLNAECRPKITKVEALIGRSHFAGNYEATGPGANPSKDVFMIELDNVKEYVQFLPYLPDGFGFTGGTARNALLALLGEKPNKPRDMDVEGIEELITNDRDRALVSKEFTPGVGRSEVNVSENVATYFASRDFTINEVFLYGNKLYFSRQALNDTVFHIVRPTDAELYDDDDIVELRSKILIKSLLFQAEMINVYGQGELQGIDPWQWTVREMPAFEIAMGINKASQKHTSMEFLTLLFERKLLSLKDLPEGATLQGLRNIQHLLERKMRQEHEWRQLEFNDAYFNEAYPRQQKNNIPSDIDDTYDKLHSRKFHSRKISSDDLDY